MRQTTLKKDFLFSGLILIILILVPFFTSSRITLDFIIRLASFGIFATSLNILVGYGGLVSFGHAMFFCAGAYSFSLLLQKLNFSIPLAFFLTIFFCSGLGILVGAICVKLKEIYFSFLTLAFQMLFHSIIITWTSLTGGDQGLTGGIERVPFWGVDLTNHNSFYWFSCVVGVTSIFLIRLILQSSFGYTLRMVRDNSERAKYLGINVWRVKLYAFILASSLAGVGGIIMALFVSGAFPDFGYWTMSGEAIFMIMMGGINVFIGPVIGASLLLLFNDVITRTTEYHGIALGVVVLMFALGFRRGIADYFSELLIQKKIIKK